MKSRHNKPDVNGVASVFVRDGQLVINWGNRKDITPIPKKRAVYNTTPRKVITAVDAIAYIPDPNEPKGRKVVTGEEARAFNTLSSFLDKLLESARFKAISFNRPIQRTSPLRKHILTGIRQGQPARVVIPYYP